MISLIGALSSERYVYVCLSEGSYQFFVKQICLPHIEMFSCTDSRTNKSKLMNKKQLCN